MDYTCLKKICCPTCLLTLIIAAIVCFSAVSANLPPPSSPLEGYSFSKQIFDGNGKLARLTTSSDEKYRIFVPLNEIPESIIKATLEQEDKWFYYHPGVNPFSIVRATLLNLTTSRVLGASTISMQLARLKYNLYTKSVFGKFKQILCAFYLEAKYSKSKILESYFNIAPYGGNIEGVGAASLIYFSKEPALLTLSESISLSVVPQNPSQRKLNNLKALTAFEKARREVFAGIAENFSERLREVNLKKEKLPFFAPHLVERSLREKTTDRKINLSLDLDFQRAFERIGTSYLKEKSKLGVKNYAAILVSNSDLSVKAYVGSADFFNSTIAGQVDIIQSRRSPGSALKPFIYALAIDQGIIHPGSILKDVQFLKANYNPENFDKEFLGPIPATEALIRSRNSPAVSLLNEIGPDLFLKFLSSAGVRNLKNSNFYGLALALGGEEVRMDELAALYAGLANGGQFAPVRFYQNQEFIAPVRLLDQESAFLTLQMLATNPRPEEGGSDYSLNSTKTIAWKTGTSFGFRDAWAAGIVGAYSLVVWLGNADSKGNPEFIGRELAGPLFFRFADYLIKESGYQSEYLKFQGKAKRINVCNVSGELPGPYCKTTKNSWFIPGKSPIRTCSVHREIEIKDGRRVCPGSNMEGVARQIYEFWPSDLMELFKKAGLPRVQPPTYPNSCNEMDLQGKVPLISSPSSAVEYVIDGSEFKIPLSAVIDGSSKKIFWFIDDSFLLEGSSGETEFWSPNPGEYAVRVVDDQGRGNLVAVKVRGE